MHPDKLPGFSNKSNIFLPIWFYLIFFVAADDLSVEMELVAEAVFIVITDAFNKYRARIEAESS